MLTKLWGFRIGNGWHPASSETGGARAGPCSDTPKPCRKGSCPAPHDVLLTAALVIARGGDEQLWFEEAARHHEG